MLDQKPINLVHIDMHYCVLTQKYLHFVFKIFNKGKLR